MHIEILSFQGCPNANPTRKAVQRAVALEGVQATITFCEVDTPELAERLQFLGSPSVRVNGDDVDPCADDRTAYGLMCRVYDSGADGPSVAMIRAAIRGHTAVAAESRPR